jgi:hypothetical protein
MSMSSVRYMNWGWFCGVYRGKGAVLDCVFRSLIRRDFHAFFVKLGSAVFVEAYLEWNSK